MPRCPSGVEVEVTGGAVGAPAQAHAARASATERRQRPGLLAPNGDVLTSWA